MRHLPSLILLILAASACAGEAVTPAKAREELKSLQPELQRLSRAYNLVHEIVAPSVVSIKTREQLVNPFDRRGGVREVDVGEGSGFIFSTDAKHSFILTNAHVVIQTGDDNTFRTNRAGQPIGYDRIRVGLNDNREIDAEYVGYDLQTDLAVIRVPLPGLPAVEWADSEQTHIGDHVVALGFPLGVGFSATFGNVSATDRSTGIYAAVGGFESFIQTDAAINPGNSGGPLVDIQARVLGVNANIVSRGGGSIGLGFAIPSNLARRVAEDIVQFGKVRRAAIGIRMDELAGAEAARLGLPAITAVRIAQISPLSPAAEAGLQTGDVVQAVGDAPVRSQHQFRARIAACRIGEPLNLRVWRQGKSLDLRLVPVAAEDLERRLAEAAGPAGGRVELPFGLTLGTDERAGLVVLTVDAASPAAQVLAPGDRILGERLLGPLRTLEDAAQLRSRREVALEVLKGGRVYWLRLRR